MPKYSSADDSDYHKDYNKILYHLINMVQFKVLKTYKNGKLR